MYSVGVRNVHHEGHEHATELSLQTIGVSLLAHRTEHAKSISNKHICASPTNSGRAPGNHDIFAVRHRISPIDDHCSRTGKSCADSIHLPVCCAVVCSLPHANDHSTPNALGGV